MPSRPAAALAALLLSASCCWAATLRLGALGDSRTHEYAAQGYGPAKNWVENLAVNRPGYLDFGSVTAARHRYNKGTGGARTTDVVANQVGPLTSLIQNDGIEVVTLLVGANDVFGKIQSSPAGWDSAALATQMADRITSAATTVLASDGAVKLVLSTEVDVSRIPALTSLPAALKSNVRATVLALNIAIRNYAAANPSRVALADIFAAFDPILAQPTYTLGGATVQVQGTSTTNPLMMFINDGVHPGTIGQSLIANEFLSAMNGTFGLSVPALSASEILTYAGVPEPSALGFAAVALLVTRRRHKPQKS